MIKKTLFIFLFFFSFLSAKVRLMTFHYNRPDFLEMQIKLLKKFILDDYELIVFNDAPRPESAQAIENVCQKYDVQCVRYLQDWHNNHPLTYKVLSQIEDPSLLGSYLGGMHKGQEAHSIAGNGSMRHCHVIQFALDYFGYDHNDIIAILDGDFFPIRSVSIRSLLNKKDLIGSYKTVGDAKYLWVPFVAADMRTLPNKKDLKFHLDVIRNNLYDTGSHSHYYLVNNPKVRVKKYRYYSKEFPVNPNLNLEKYNFNKSQIEAIHHILGYTNMELHIDFCFLHTVGSSWLGTTSEKEIMIERFLNDLISN